MYIPPTFAQTDLPTLYAFIERHSFGLLIDGVGAEPFVTHLPFLLDRDAGPCGTLLGHTAAANPQARRVDGQTVLAVFSGPHAYVSPSWYEASNVVPTWNYQAVHVYGTLHVVEQPAALAEILQASVQFYEGSTPTAWQFDPASPFAQKLMQQIVGFRIEICRLEGKWKLSQNQPAERRAKVERALRDAPDPEAQAVAEQMRWLDRGTRPAADDPPEVVSGTPTS